MFVFSQINFKSDTLLLSILNLPATIRLNNTESVAIYGLAFKIFEVALVLPTFFMNSAYPVLVRHMQEGKDKLKQTFTTVISYLIAGGVLAGVLGVVFSGFMIKLIGGSQFTESILTIAS